jgi:hypothetical protein
MTLLRGDSVRSIRCCELSLYKVEALQGPDQPCALRIVMDNGKGNKVRTHADVWYRDRVSISVCPNSGLHIAVL